MTSSTQLTLSEGALRQNLRFLRRRVGSHPVLSSVVKGNAYGHGIETYVPLAERCGVRHFSVFSAAEARRVRAASTTGSEILIMGDIGPNSMEWVVAEGVGFFVFDLARLDAAQKVAKRVGRPARVHLEVETGLNRTGLKARSLGHALKRMQKHPDLLRLEGLCTHLAGAESSANEVRILAQLDRFDEASARASAAGFPRVLRHVACSAAALVHERSRMDLVRVGIAQYGFWPSEEVRFRVLGAKHRRRPVLRRLLTWRSRVMNLKQVKGGDFIGYGHNFQAQRTMKVAAVPVGYADGFPRDLSNRGRVLIGGERCGVLGAVNMSMTLVDVTFVPDVQVGDEVVLIGEQGDHEISVGAFGEMVHSLNYEVLLRLADSIPRAVVD